MNVHGKELTLILAEKNYDVIISGRRKEKLIETAKINKNSWTVPPLFRHIMKEGNVSENEMFDVFNMGVGIILIVEPAKKNHILAQCENSWVIGELFPKKQDEENVQIL